MDVRELNTSDREWVVQILIESWGSCRVVSRGVVHQADSLPGVVAEHDAQRVGLLTYNINQDALEIVTLNVLRPREGIGRALIEEVIETAKSRKCSRLWVITTNDNTPAIKFYQALGFRIAAVHKDAIRDSRKLKPIIPLTGINGIPITDEIELELNKELLDSNTNTYL